MHFNHMLAKIQPKNLKTCSLLVISSARQYSFGEPGPPGFAVMQNNAHNLELWYNHYLLIFEKENNKNFNASTILKIIYMKTK